MKVVKNIWFKCIMFLVGFVGAVLAIAGAFSGIARIKLYDKDTGRGTPSFMESDFLKDYVFSDVESVQNVAASKIDFDEEELGNRSIDIVDYQSNETTKVSLKDLSMNNSIAYIVGAYYNQYESSYYYTNESGENYASVIPEETVGKYIKISLKDYVGLIKKNGSKNDAELNDKLANSTGAGVDDVVPEDIDYYISDGDSFLLYSEKNNYLYRLGNLEPNGHQDLDRINGNYIYVAYPEKELKDKELENYILTSFMYCGDNDVLFGSLSKEEREASSVASSVENYSPFKTNTAFSFDGKKIGYCYIINNENFEDVTSYDRTGERYGISYNELCKRLQKQSDVYIEYNADSDKLTQWYKKESGEIKEFSYISDSELASLKNLADSSFVLGMNKEDDVDGLGTAELAFELAGIVPHPEACLIIGMILFLSAVVLLTISCGNKIIWLDWVPYIVFCFVFALLGVISVIVMKIMAEYGSEIVSLVNSGTMGLVFMILLYLGVIYAICAAMYLSVVRRIKARRFQYGFVTVLLVCLFLKLFKKMGQKGKGGRVLFVVMIGFVIISILLILLITVMASYMRGEVVFPVILLILIDVAMVIFVSKYMTEIEAVLSVSRRIEDGELDAKVDTEKLSFNVRELGESMNSLGDGLANAVETSVREERTKAELITNVSHDIKTPLTSIISYVDLLKREKIDNPKAVEYINVLDEKSERLKQLILDLIDASKVSTGNIELERVDMNLVELIRQVIGEYEDKFEEKTLELVENITVDSAVINADGRRIFRVFDNLMNNVYNYAKSETRVYLNLGMSEDSKNVIVSIKNISSEMLNISAEELTERFVRGDKSRYTEGSGLGLSIARNLVELHGGTFKLKIDGDLFTAIVSFAVC